MIKVICDCGNEMECKEEEMYCLVDIYYCKKCNKRIAVMDYNTAYELMI